MLKRKELIICIISIVVLMLAIATNVFATNTDVNALLGNNSNETSNNQPNSIPNATINNNAAINNNATSNNNTQNNNTVSIPYTGVNYSVIVIIAICGISTIYAYKKIRDYNV